MPDRTSRFGRPEKGRSTRNRPRKNGGTPCQHAPIPAIALTLLLTAACDDTPVAPADRRPPPTPAEGLTVEESVALFRGITRLSFADANALHPGSLLIECPKGGQVEVIETIEEFQADGGRPEMDVAFTIVPTRCRMRSQGNLFIVDGNPSLRIDMHLEEGRLGFREVVYITGTIAGDLGWQLHNRSGVCPILGTLDAWASVVPDPDSRDSSGYFTGSVCGHEVKIDTSELLQPPPFAA